MYSSQDLHKKNLPLDYTRWKRLIRNESNSSVLQFLSYRLRSSLNQEYGESLTNRLHSSKSLQQDFHVIGILALLLLGFQIDRTSSDTIVNIHHDSHLEPTYDLIRCNVPNKKRTLHRQ